MPQGNEGTPSSPSTSSSERRRPPAALETLVLHVPDLFFGECANVLWKYVRRHGYDAATALLNLADLVFLGLLVTPTSGLVAAAFPLAVDETITAYDAL